MDMQYEQLYRGERMNVFLLRRAIQECSIRFQVAIFFSVRR